MAQARTLDYETVPRLRGYETDFAGWSEDTARAIREGRWQDIDREAVAEEIESLGRSDKRLIRSAFEVLLLHLLKQRYQPEKASRSGQISIFNARLAVTELLAESPSLRPLRDLAGETMVKAYAAARQAASLETDLPINTFPDALPFAESELWGDDQ